MINSLFAIVTGTPGAIGLVVLFALAALSIPVALLMCLLPTLKKRKRSFKYYLAYGSLPVICFGAYFGLLMLRGFFTIFFTSDAPVSLLLF